MTGAIRNEFRLDENGYDSSGQFECFTTAILLICCLVGQAIQYSLGGDWRGGVGVGECGSKRVVFRAMCVCERLQVEKGGHEMECTRFELVMVIGAYFIKQHYLQMRLKYDEGYRTWIECVFLGG